MKMNKNIFAWSILAFGALSLTACSDKDEPGGGSDSGNTDGNEIIIKTQVKLNTKTALIEDLVNGHEMNVFANVTDDSGATVKDVTTHAANNNGEWKLDDPVRLSKGYTAEVMAAYPYAAGLTDYKQYPVDVTTQADVLYSGKGSFASSTSNTVTLNMKHALSMVSLNIKLEGYSGAGHITAIKLSQPALIATKGTMNIATGAIAPTDFGVVSATTDNTATANGISGALPGMWVIPFTSKDQDPVAVTITIDGKEFTVDLPEVTMKTGWQYVFQGVMTAHGLTFNPTATEEYELNMKDDEFVPLNGFGMISLTFSGSTFAFPDFAGDNIFGNVSAADGSTANYTIGGSLKLKNTAAQQIVVETWNSTGFTINSTEGIDAIDLSNY